MSLQTNERDSKPLYENREQFHTSQKLINISELAVPYGSPRRASCDDGVFNASSSQGTSSKASATDSVNRTYQNVQRHGRSSFPEVSTQPQPPHLSATSVPLPDSYYNVTPPPLVMKNTSGNGSPSSSPEDKISIHDLRTATRSPTTDIVPPIYMIPRLQDERCSPEVSMDAVGDNLVANKPSRRSKAFSPTFDNQTEGTLYQNVEFMRSSNGDGPSKR